MTKRALVLLSIVAAGCAGQGSSSSSTAGELTVAEQQGQASGHFIDHSDADLGRVDFTSRFVDTNVLDIELRFHGLTVTATVDFDSGVIEYDGFTTSNGQGTQILEDDRALMLAFARALDARGTHVSEPLSRVRSFANTWAEFPATLDPQGLSLVDDNRSYSSICYALNTYQRATHDCWETTGSCSDWWGCSDGDDPSTTDYAYVSMHANCGAADGTNFWQNNAWRCYEPNHDSNIEYGYGNCLGRCGADCGSSTQFTWDCLNHDECVRTGHDLASAWCDDEFTSTVDDWTAAPNC
jgi:hypothetical protein